MAEMVVAVDGTVPVTGTITTTPSGTQAVSITGQPISMSMTNTSTTPFFVALAPDPAITGVYSFCLPDVPGVVAANNFITLFNPVGSGKVLFALSATVSSYVAGGGNTTKASMLGTRITTSTGGTLQAASAINKIRTSFANPAAEIRIGNPTVTTGANILAFPPPIGTDTASTNERIVAAAGASLTLAAGEGVVFRTTAGDTDENFDISFTWGEA